MAEPGPALPRQPLAMVSTTSRLIAAAVGMALCLPAVAACTTHYIPNTDVEDTDENRKLIGFCEKYRHAVERKDVALLLKLASPKYYEDGGNVDASDDLDYSGLKDNLTNRFLEARAIRYEIRYRRVVKEDDRIFVDYTFSASYRIPGVKAEEWRRRVEDNRLELEPYQGDFRIIAGM